MVIMAVTSQLRSPGVTADLAIVHWREAGLLKSSVIKPVITTIERGLVRRKLGRLEAADRQSLGVALRELLGP